ncbi:MAG: M3 family metallopeptidase [Oscillospiraceae bacterium]|jgi:M3 family oligoendopeptidase|nr:M3 family metallopeptidase [Oscillospiraceae bacterium]
MNRLINRAAALILAAAILLTAASCANSAAEVTLPARTFEHQSVSFDDIEYVEYTRDEMAGRYETFVSDFKAAKSPNEQAEVIFAEDDFTRELLLTSSILLIKYYKNLTDEKARDRYFALSDILAELNDFALPYMKLLAESKFREALTRRFGEDYFYKLDKTLEGYDPALSAITQQTTRYTDEYNQLRGNPGVTYEGETYSLNEIYEYWQTDIDFGIMLLNEFWKSNNKACAEIFMPLLKLRQEQAKLCGFDNYYDYFYSDKDILGYGKDETFAFDQYVKKYISPIYMEIKSNYAKALGFDILPYDYDIARLYSESYAVKQELLDDENKYYEVLLNTIEKVSPEAGAIVKVLDSIAFIDLATDENKRVGGYTVLLRGVNQPFVFAQKLNANVAFHELGHAVNLYETVGCAELITQETPDTAYIEIHSSTMEVLAMKYFNDIYTSSENAIKAWTFDMLDEIINAAMFDEFQRYIYTTENITMEMINTEYAKLREEYLGATDFEPFTPLKDGVSWIYDSHAFASPFYSVQYAIATTVSLEFYELSLGDYDAAVDKYMKICKLDSSVYNLVEALEECGLKNVFSEETVENAGKTLRATLLD